MCLNGLPITFWHSPDDATDALPQGSGISVAQCGGSECKRCMTCLRCLIGFRSGEPLLIHSSNVREGRITGRAVSGCSVAVAARILSLHQTVFGGPLTHGGLSTKVVLLEDAVGGMKFATSDSLTSVSVNPFSSVKRTRHLVNQMYLF